MNRNLDGIYFRIERNGTLIYAGDIVEVSEVSEDVK